MGYSKDFEVANPSSYPRSDYVDVDMQMLGVPKNLDQKSLRLFRINPDDSLTEIPYQIDYILGRKAGNRIMTFLSTHTPPGPDDYSCPTAWFRLEEGEPFDFSLPYNSLWIGYYHKSPKPDESEDGFNCVWDKARDLYGVKLYNTRLEIYFSLVSHPRVWSEIDYTGSATSIFLEGAPEDMLSPWEPFPSARWGQLTDLVLFPLDQDSSQSQKVSLFEKEYEIVWSSSGLLRAGFTLKSEPIVITYKGSPSSSEPEEKRITCNLYRVIHVYPDKPHYTEELFVRTEDGHSISFSPYYYSSVHSVPGVNRELKRFDHIPDYFAVWMHFATLYYGFSFAADEHIRNVQTYEDEIRWGLPPAQYIKSVHLFMFHSIHFGLFDPFHEIGHYGWYERILKPLEVIPLAPNSLRRI
jgi:hypothetical protein